VPRRTTPAFLGPSGLCAYRGARLQSRPDYIGAPAYRGAPPTDAPPPTEVPHLASAATAPRAQVTEQQLRTAPIQLSVPNTYFPNQTSAVQYKNGQSCFHTRLSSPFDSNSSPFISVPKVHWRSKSQSTKSMQRADRKLSKTINCFR
jgi:hypothetical protein